MSSRLCKHYSFLFFTVHSQMRKRPTLREWVHHCENIWSTCTSSLITNISQWSSFCFLLLLQDTNICQSNAFGLSIRKTVHVGANINQFFFLTNFYPNEQVSNLEWVSSPLCKHLFDVHLPLANEFTHWQSHAFGFSNRKWVHLCENITHFCSFLHFSKKRKCPTLREWFHHCENIISQLPKVTVGNLSHTSCWDAN